MIILHSLSLRDKLLVFAAALVLVPGLLLGWIADRSGRSSLETVIGRQLAREAGHTAERLSAMLHRERETLRSFARQHLMREIRVEDIDKRVSLALRTLRDGNPARIEYLVVVPGDRVVASSSPSLLGPAPAWAKEPAVATGAADRLSGPVRTPLAEERVLLMSASIPDPDEPSRRLGALVGLFDWKLLTAVTEGVRQDLASQGVAADVLVADENGAILGGARSHAEPWHDESATGPRAFGAAEPGPSYVVDAESELIVGRASLAADLPEWHLLVVEPLSHALAPARRLTKRLAATMGVALLAALAIATLSARRVVKPLSELTRAIRDLPHRDPASLRVPVRSEDEVGTLSAAFNHMATELDRVQRDLIEAEKFAFVGELASGVAHEVRTSLGVLRSAAQIVERSLPAGAGAEAAELALMIREEVDRLAGVVNDLLTLDRPRPLQLEATPVSAPVFRAIDFVEPRAHEKGIAIRRFLAPREPLVKCDSEMVYQICVNLLVNAVESLEQGGTIAVHVLEERNGFGGFEVRDDGCGIPEALRDKIFEPFVSAREGGVGLGLTFVKRVVHDHRGRVLLVPGIGSGGGFRIDLPLATEAPS